MDQATPDKTTDGLLRIGQLAELCGKTVRALHLYEEMGLLKPVHRTKGGFRLYAKSAVNRVQWIGRLQDADVSLSEIKDFLRDLEEEQVASAAMTRVRALFEKKLQEIRRQQMVIPGRRDVGRQKESRAVIRAEISETDR